MVEIHMPRGTTIVVAASNSLTKSADYTCPGTTDNVMIQAVIDEVYAAGGGKVIFLEGEYDIAATIDLKSNVSLEGMGKWATIFNPSADIWIMATTGVTGQEDGNSIHYIDISGIHFGDGAWGDITCDGIDLSWGHNIKIHDCAFIQIKGVCIQYLESFRDEIYDCDFQDCGYTIGTDAVVWIKGVSNAEHSDDIRIYNNDFLMCEYMSIRTTYDQAHLWISNNYFENDETTPESLYHIGSTDDSGFWDSWVLDNFFYYVEDKHILQGNWTANNLISGNKFSGGVQAYVCDTFGSNEAHRREIFTHNHFIDQTGVALQLADPYYCIITDNVFEGDAGQYNFYPTDGVGWVFTGNAIESGLGINNENNIGEIIRNNYGYYNDYPYAYVMDCFDRGMTKNDFGNAYDITTLASGAGTIDITTTISEVTMVTGATIGNTEGLQIIDPVGLRSREYFAEIKVVLAQITDTDFHFGFYKDADEYVLIEFDASANANWRLTVADTTAAEFSSVTGGEVAASTEYFLSLWVETDGTPHWRVGTTYAGRAELGITGIANKMTADAHYVRFMLETEADAAKTAEVCYLETKKNK